MTSDNKSNASKIVQFQKKQMDAIEREDQVALEKMFRGEISPEEYYQTVHRDRRSPCPNCGHYH